MERILSNGMHVYAPLCYDGMSRTARNVAENIKHVDADDSYFLLAAYKISSYIPNDAILVAVPDSKGWNGANRRICAELEKLVPGTKEICALHGSRRMSVRDIKRNKGRVYPDDLLMCRISRFVGMDDSPVVLIDNVIDTGVTMIAAANALGCKCIGVAYAMTNEQLITNNSNNQIKNEKIMNETKTVNKNGKTYLVCGNCGAEIPLPEHEHYAAGRVLAQDSGLGKVVLPTKNGNNNVGANTNVNGFDMAQMMQMMTQMMQMMTQNPEIKDAMVQTIKQTFGVDTPNAAPSVTEAQSEQVKNVEEIKEKMKKMNNVWLERGYHNHVYRQMFEDYGLSLEYYGNKPVCCDNFTNHLNSLGVEYMWNTLYRMAEVMMVLQRKDPEDFRHMYRCFSKDVLHACAFNWFNSLEIWIKTECDTANGRRKSDGKKGKYYKTSIFSNYDNLYGRGVFVDELASVLNRLYASVELIAKAQTPTDVFQSFMGFCKVRKSVKFVDKMPYEFKDAFKMWGAYCVMDILINYDDVFMFEGMDKGKDATRGSKLSRYESHKMLEEIMFREYEGEYEYKGFQVFGILKELIARNEFDYNAKKAAYKEWYSSTKA